MQFLVFASQSIPRAILANSFVGVLHREEEQVS